MKVVIDIPNWLYNAIMECKEPDYSKSLGDAVRDGTPLPKGHGRLIDADALIRVMDDRAEKLKGDRDLYDASVIVTAVDMFASTIIEADKEGEQG